MINDRLIQLAQLLEENPNDSFINFAYAKELEKAGKYENAMQVFENLLVIDENYIGTYYHLAKLYELNNDFNKALNIYNKGIEIATKQKTMHALKELQQAKMNLEIEME
ncbi:MAG: tetratricopeptide repeat protein [Chitinophagales bacterium]|nr:tetratricopeptide repeat protein [Chitinophagales bacterium]